MLPGGELHCKQRHTVLLPWCPRQHLKNLCHIYITSPASILCFVIFFLLRSALTMAHSLLDNLTRSHAIIGHVAVDASYVETFTCILDPIAKNGASSSGRVHRFLFRVSTIFTLHRCLIVKRHDWPPLDLHSMLVCLQCQIVARGPLSEVQKGTEVHRAFTLFTFCSHDLEEV